MSFGIKHFKIYFKTLDILKKLGSLKLYVKIHKKLCKPKMKVNVLINLSYSKAECTLIKIKITGVFH